MSFRREKALPDIPVDIDAGSAVEAGQSNIANTNKALPSINVENMLSEGDMSRLHELWNGAGLSARAHRRRRRGPNPTPRRVPAPISIPDPEHIHIPIILSSADPSTTSTTPSTAVARKRWGFRSARPFCETQEAGKKVPNALEKLRVMAQDRLKKKLRYAKSAPNLGDQAAPLERGVTPQYPMPMSAEAPPREVEASSSRTPSSPSELATPEVILQPEDMDENAIYFTFDPNWRASQDSPLLHRHYSLDQLSFAAQEATTALTTMEFRDMYPSDEVLHPIDELHAYLEL